MTRSLAKFLFLDQAPLTFQQLAPAVQSSRARYYGFANSLITELGRPGSLSLERSSTFLNNYRSHPQILAWPSQAFYGNRLVALAPPQKTGRFLTWHRLKRNFPVLFVPVRGYDQRDTDSPSWYNKSEAEKLVSLVVEQCHEFRDDVSSEDLGIITATQKQGTESINLRSCSHPLPSQGSEGFAIYQNWFD